MGKHCSRCKDKQREVGWHSAILIEMRYKEKKKPYNIEKQDEQQERYYSIPAHCEDQM